MKTTVSSGSYTSIFPVPGPVTANRPSTTPRTPGLSGFTRPRRREKSATAKGAGQEVHGERRDRLFRDCHVPREISVAESPDAHGVASNGQLLQPGGDNRVGNRHHGVRRRNIDLQESRDPREARLVQHVVARELKPRGYFPVSRLSQEKLMPALRDVGNDERRKALEIPVHPDFGPIRIRDDLQALLGGGDLRGRFFLLRR